MIEIRETSSGVSFAVRLQPKAKKTAIIGELNGALKLGVTDPPIDGRANEALIRFVAGLLKVTRSSVTIAAGESSRNKVIRIEGVTAEQVRFRLKVW
ncbi:protein of unknown function DUF167 [Candidatus Koribacter versatilis Ellin345]|uniref:UPF0235 protein Acid345_4205 n=1 Tax=Koribacter versatilis (strain Ellin345) TaxID=204669 RepID=Y4205_KORVE|nr:DUF167 domain-containing protein [Candidatus Koribacter versatilis]Q1IIU5.1 RecName: Full=UPF0235 protein Acid345_4205 [Candidatus Koribacter versatilis Ellin345]ABF43205.1 protein of unknown function DUF167 [Candidatus Koribacter versatilis Ellin345]